MTTQNHEAAMLNAGMSSAQSNRDAALILKIEWQSIELQVEAEKRVSVLRNTFYAGAIMGACDHLDEATARAYLPDTTLPVGKQCAFKPYPVKEPETFDAKAHRPEAVQRAYDTARVNWINCRKVAGLPALRAVTPKGAKAGEGEKPNAPTRINGIVEIPAKLDTAAAMALVKEFDAKFASAVDGSSEKIVGETGSILRQIVVDLHEYVKDLARAYASEQPTSIAAQVEAEELRKANAAAMAELAAMKAELAVAREAAVLAAQAAVKSPRKAKAEKVAA